MSRTEKTIFTNMCMLAFIIVLMHRHLFETNCCSLVETFMKALEICRRISSMLF